MTADVPVLIGIERYLQLCDETVWGEEPETPTYIDYPLTEYGVIYKPKRRDGQSRTGRYQESYGENVSGHPSGSMVTPLFGKVVSSKSLAQRLMEWGFTDQENQFPISKCSKWQYAGHEDDKAHLGLRVNQITLAGSEAGIVLTLELIGKTAVNFTGSGSPPDSRNKLYQFLFEDSIVKLGGTAVPVSQWQWSVQRNLDVIYHNSRTPISMPKNSWIETFSCTPLKADDTYDALRDAGGMVEMTGELTVMGLHGGTGTALTNFNKCVTAFPRLSMINADETGGEKTVMQPLTFKVLKPDSSSNGSTMTWSDVA